MKRTLLFLVAVFALIITTTGLVAQTIQPRVTQPAQTIQPRVTQSIDDNKRVVLKDSKHPFATAQSDRGAAPASLPMPRLQLVLKRSPEQQQALQELKDAQQNPSSPSYRKWLTPEEFGRRFGPADEDIKTVTQWLASQGFEGIHVTKGRTLIEFSGTAAQVQQAFHTPIHQYEVNGESHWANANAAEIPSALAPVVAGVAEMSNIHAKPQHVRFSDKPLEAEYKAGPVPQVRLRNGDNALAPADLAVIYNSAPLSSRNIDGSGASIAVIGRSNIDIQDVIDFRTVFGLPPNPPEIIINGSDPGRWGGGEEIEALLDNQYAAALAPNAKIKFVVSPSDFEDGVLLSEIYAIDNNVADVMTESFGICEMYRPPVMMEALRLLAEQAAVQGISYMVSAGDSGSAGCAPAGSPFAYDWQLGVNAIASPPDVVSVGGTQFNEGGNPDLYWANTNDPATRANALSYIPEDVWDESCVDCNNGSGFVFGTGGGDSIRFKQPSFQTGVPGIPATDARHHPDISLTSAGGHAPYLVCGWGSCHPDADGKIQGFYAVGGTSAAAPTFAGIMALVNQHTGSRQGNANYVLYRLAAKQDYSVCDASSQVQRPASTCVFNDVTIGSNAMPGMTGYKTADGKYPAQVGYDLATGLGSVNVTNLVDSWNNNDLKPTTVTFSANPTNVTHGTLTSFSATVSSPDGTPTGRIVLLGENGEVLGTYPLGASTGSVTDVVYLSGGTYGLVARYGGDSTFASSSSDPIPVTVLLEASNVSISTFVFDFANWELVPATSAVFGDLAVLKIQVAGASGAGKYATGDIAISDDTGMSYSGPLDPGGSVAVQFVVVPPLGPRTFTAQFHGDKSYAEGIGSVVFTLNPSPTTTVLETSPTLAAPGTPVTLYTSITAKNVYDESGGPLGTVAFFSGRTQLGDPVQVTPVSSSMFARGVASLTTTALVEGANNIVAVYSGDDRYGQSTSAPVVVTISSHAATTTTVLASTNSAVMSSPVVFTAKVVKLQAGGAAPNGTVQFAIDGTNAGQPVALGVNGQAQYSTNSLPVGNHTISATYSGSAEHIGSTGSANVEIVAAPAFTVTRAAGTISVARGASGNTAVTVTGYSGFIGNVGLNCSVSPVRVEGPACVVAPGSVSLNSTTTSAQATLTITTTAPAAVTAVNRHPRSGLPWLAVGGFGLAGTFLLRQPKQRTRGCKVLWLVMIAATISAGVACGGGGNSSPPVPTPNPGTPPGTYTVTVTAVNGGLPTQTATVTLNVQ